MATLALPHLSGATVHGWIATIGMVRVLADRYPDMTLHWDWEWGTPVLTDGPGAVDQAAREIFAATVSAVPAGGVLPGCDPSYPPDGRDWYGPDIQPASESGPWQSSLVSPSGLLHPLLVPHAAQTVRRMVAKAHATLAAKPELLREAIGGPGLGLTTSYPGGLWLLRHDRPRDEGGAQASPGRDWLALMALPWMPARDAWPMDDDVQPRRGAPGWRWRRTRSGARELVYEWRLWADPLPVFAIPAVLDSVGVLPGRSLRYGALREPRSAPSDPPYLRTLTRDEVRGGRLEDAPPLVVGAEGAASWLRAHGHPRMTAAAVRQALRRARVAREAGGYGPEWLPEPDVPVDGRTPGWRPETLAGWRPVGQGAGGGRPRKER